MPNKCHLDSDPTYRLFGDAIRHLRKTNVLLRSLLSCLLRQEKSSFSICVPSSANRFCYRLEAGALGSDE